jgi:hypothetical protein
MSFWRGSVGGEEVSEAPFSRNFTDFFSPAGGVKGLTSKPRALSAMASTANHGPPTPVPQQRACSPHHGRLRVRQQRGGGKQLGNGVCSAELAAAARWQRWQSSGGSAAVAWRWRAARRGRRRQSGGSGGNTVAALAARWRRRQRGGSVGRSSTAAAWRKRAPRRWHLQRSGGIASARAAASVQWRQ